MATQDATLSLDPELLVETYRPLALLVGRDEAGLQSLARKLEDRGWTVGTCRGPEARGCPLINGGACVLRDDADVTVMFMDPSPARAMLARVICAAHGDTPSVVALEGRIDRPRVEGRHVVVGAAWGPEPIVEAVGAAGSL